MSRYIDADLLGSLVDSHGNVHYEHIKSMPSMTFEELKAEAKRQGYNLVKIFCGDTEQEAKEYGTIKELRRKDEID